MYNESRHNSRSISNIHDCWTSQIHLHMFHSTLNVEPKYLTSPIFLKFCGQLSLAIKWWHAKFENDRLTFRALFGHFAGAAHKVPKKGLKLPQFSSRSNFLINYGTANFYISKSRFNYFLSDKLVKFCKKRIGGSVTGCSIFFVIFEWPFSGLFMSKHLNFDFSVNFLKFCKNPN